MTGDLSEFVRIRKDFVMNRVWDIINDTIVHIRELRVFRSFRMRIFLLMLIIGIVPIIIVQSAILNNYETRAVSVRTDEVSNQLMVIANHLLIYNYLQDTNSEIINAELDQLSSLYDGRVLIINSNFNVVKDTYGLSEGKTVISKEVIECFKGKIATNYDRINGFIEITTPITETTDALQYEKGNTKVKGVMLTSVSTDAIAMTLEILSRKVLIIEIVICIAIFAVAMVISRFLTRPFDKVTGAINEVKEGFTNEALQVPDYKETEHIVDAFNQVLHRMKVLDESREEFVSNVSHELRTPLTSMKVLSDSLLMQEDVPNELYKEFMQDIAAEIDRENRIINDLLTLVKLDKTSGDLDVTSVSVNETIELILKRLRPIARKQDVEVIFESNRSVVAEIDEVKITLALTNLVENAIKYNKEHGFVKVILDADHQFFTVQVEDSGIGIPESSYEYIFQRFYREDKSHSKEIGGTGLGLSITRNIILMHRGTIAVSSVMGEGTTFTVKIPLIYIRQEG